MMAGSIPINRSITPANQYRPQVLSKRTKGLVRSFSLAVRALWYSTPTTILLASCEAKTALYLLGPLLILSYLAKSALHKVQAGSVSKALQQELEGLSEASEKEQKAIKAGVNRELRQIAQNKATNSLYGQIVTAENRKQLLENPTATEVKDTTPPAPAAEKLTGGELLAMFKNPATRRYALQTVLSGRVVEDREILELAAVDMKKGLPIDPAPLTQILNKLGEERKQLNDLEITLLAHSLVTELKTNTANPRDLIFLAEFLPRGRAWEADAGNRGNIKKLLQQIIETSISAQEQGLAKRALSTIEKAEEATPKGAGGGGDAAAEAGPGAGGAAPARKKGGK